MELTFKFLSNEKWSIHGTLNVLIILVIFLATKQKINAQSLIFMSLLGMMEGTLITKIIFTTFLNFLVYEPTKEWIFKSILFLIGTIITHYIPLGNKLEQIIQNNNIFLNIFRIIVLAWIVYILYLIILPLNKWKI
jgi:hypothetical protein